MYLKSFALHVYVSVLNLPLPRLCSLCSASCQDDSLQYHTRRKHTFRQTLHANGFNVFSQLMIFNLR